MASQVGSSNYNEGRFYLNKQCRNGTEYKKAE